tara:strand:- start:367 stop:648 length:282 start_codon:yes stop_codon:yes gene_type:complete
MPYFGEVGFYAYQFCFKKYEKIKKDNLQILDSTMAPDTIRDATPEEQAEWFETDFFMKGDFDVMKLFVVIPAVVQVVVFGMMLAVMLFNSYLF